MTESSRPTAPRIYCYIATDTFGLAPSRRSRAIAEALVSALEGSSALILTGSPVAGRFTFSPGVDHIRMPGVVKTVDADYVSESLNMDIEQTTGAARQGHPRGGRDVQSRSCHRRQGAGGFSRRTHHHARNPQGDGAGEDRARHPRHPRFPEALSQEWERKGALDIADKFYDQFWVYGDQSIYNPLQSLAISDDFKRRMHYTGHLRRVVPHESPRPPCRTHPYVLVTPGGGGDGEALVDWTLRAYENDPTLQPNALIVYAAVPVMASAAWRSSTSAWRHWSRASPPSASIPASKRLMQNALGVVAMGGYNTFCEILSFDCRAVIAPRTRAAHGTAHPRFRRRSTPRPDPPCSTAIATATAPRSWPRRSASWPSRVRRQARLPPASWTGWRRSSRLTKSLIRRASPTA